MRFYERTAEGEHRETFAVYRLDTIGSLSQGVPVYSAASLDEPTWAGLLDGAPDRVTSQGAAIVTTVRNNCAFCHNFASPGPGHLVGYTTGRPREPLDSTASQCELTRRYLMNSEPFARLREDLERIGRGTS